MQTNYTSDPAPMVSNGQVYLITTHDENSAGQPCSAVAGYTLCQWFAYSSADMVNWTDHGVVASWKSFSWASTAAWAPQAIPRNGKFYLYVPLSNTSGATVIGVGVSNSPIGPYTDAIGKPLVTAGCSGGTGDIDPTVFIDDDGQAYLYFGRSVPGYVKLNSDMISYTGGVQCPTVNSQSFGPAPSSGGFPSQYEEGPWIMKHGTTYYLAYAANNIPEDIAYSKATSATGPFTYGGTIMKAMGASFTNHTGIIDFNGHSYFFYHNGALQKGGSVPVERRRLSPLGLPRGVQVQLRRVIPDDCADERRPAGHRQPEPVPADRSGDHRLGIRRPDGGDQRYGRRDGRHLHQQR